MTFGRGLHRPRACLDPGGNLTPWQWPRFCRVSVGIGGFHESHAQSAKFQFEKINIILLRAENSIQFSNVSSNQKSLKMQNYKRIVEISHLDNSSSLQKFEAHWAKTGEKMSK